MLIRHLNPRLLGRPSLLKNSLSSSFRPLTTLSTNSHIYVFPTGSSNLLSLLPTEPPTPSLAIGTTTSLPPTPDTFTANPSFLPIVYDVLRAHAHEDPVVQTSAGAFLATATSSFLYARAGKRRGETLVAPGGAPKEALGGFVHISDSRTPPEWARIADPEDIFGTVRVEPDGTVAEGSFEVGGMYRIVTRDGILGLSDYIRGKLVEQLRTEEQKIKGAG